MITYICIHPKQRCHSYLIIFINLYNEKEQELKIPTECLDAFIIYDVLKPCWSSIYSP